MRHPTALFLLTSLCLPLASACTEGAVHVPLATVRLDAGADLSEAFLTVAAPPGTTGMRLRVLDPDGEPQGGSVSLQLEAGEPVDVEDGEVLDVLGGGWWRVLRGDASGPLDVVVDAVLPPDDASLAHASWMADQGDALDDLTLGELCLVGAHDAGTSGINPDSPWSDSAGILGLSPATTAVRTSRAQERSLGHLLQGGVRYLDLRFDVGTDGTVRLVHSLLGQHARTGLREVAQFLDTHPAEVVVLDLQHVSGSHPDPWQVALDLLEEALGHRAAPASLDLTTPLGTMRADGVQAVVLVGGAPQAGLGDARAWDREANLVSPWGNKQDLDALFTFLDEELAQRPPRKLYVVQGVMTPNASLALNWANEPTQSVITEPCADDDTQIGLCGLARVTNPALLGWMQDDWAGRDLDIVMVDHPELSPFVQACIDRLPR